MKTLKQLIELGVEARNLPMNPAMHPKGSPEYHTAMLGHHLANNELDKSGLHAKLLAHVWNKLPTHIKNTIHPNIHHEIHSAIQGKQQ